MRYYDLNSMKERAYQVLKAPRHLEYVLVSSLSEVSTSLTCNIFVQKLNIAFPLLR